MEKTNIGRIRKITIGQDPLKAMSYEVKKTFRTPEGDLTITEIVEDQSSYYFFGNVRYLVYVEKPDKTNVLWKAFESMPVTIECFV